MGHVNPIRLLRSFASSGRSKIDFCRQRYLCRTLDFLSKPVTQCANLRMISTAYALDEIVAQLRRELGMRKLRYEPSCRNVSGDKHASS
jgi:hypothetical protein